MNHFKLVRYVLLDNYGSEMKAKFTIQTAYKEPVILSLKFIFQELSPLDKKKKILTSSK